MSYYVVTNAIIRQILLKPNRISKTLMRIRFPQNSTKESGERARAAPISAATRQLYIFLCITQTFSLHSALSQIDIHAVEVRHGRAMHNSAFLIITSSKQTNKPFDDTVGMRRQGWRRF